MKDSNIIMDDTGSKPICAVCLMLEGNVYEFTGMVFENQLDAKAYIKARKEKLKKQIESGDLPENLLKLESLKHFDIVTGRLYPSGAVLK